MQRGVHTNECSGVGAKVEEEIRQNVAGDEASLADVVVTKAHDAENDCEESEAHELNRLAANGVNHGDCNPVSGNGSGANENQVADCCVIKNEIEIGAAAVSDGLEDGCVVQADAVKGHVQEKPGASSAEKDLAVLPLTVVCPEV